MRQRSMTCTSVALLVLVTAVLLAGCTSNSTADAPGKQNGSAETTFTPGAAATPDQLQNGRGVGYFCDGETVVPVRLDARADDAQGVIEALLAGPTPEAKAAGYTSAIPAATELRRMTVEKGTATIDLSSEFGSAADASSMELRVAQIVFTLTRDPAVKRVVFKIGGKPVDTLGADGPSLAGAQTRGDWERTAPAVLIEAPVLGDSVASPFQVTGTASVPGRRFEISFKGADGFTTATAQVSVEGSGTARGVFKKKLTVSPGEGALMPWYLSSGKLVYPMRVPLVIR